MKHHDSGERRIFVLDTNVLMHDPAAIFRFEEHDIYIPMIVLEELDAGKSGLSESARNVRQVSRFLDELMHGVTKEQIDHGLELPSGKSGNHGKKPSTGRLFFQTRQLDSGLPDTLPGHGADWEPVFDVCCVALAAESTGVAQRALEMAVSYAKDRQQFGRPIGSYQAVSHRCAQMLLETENSRSAVYGAAWAADADPDALPLSASMAKAYASDAGWRVPDASIQVHGGIGFTWEHDLHFFLKRGRANASMYGDARWHREQVAKKVLAPTAA